MQKSSLQVQEDVEKLKRQLAENQQTNAQLFDQNILLKAQLSAATNSTKPSATNNVENSTQSKNIEINESTKISFYQSENSRLLKEVDLLNDKLNEALEMTEQSLKLTELGQMRKDQENLMELLTDQVILLLFK